DGNFSRARGGTDAVRPYGNQLGAEIPAGLRREPHAARRTGGGDVHRRAAPGNSRDPSIRDGDRRPARAGRDLRRGALDPTTALRPVKSTVAPTGGLRRGWSIMLRATAGGRASRCNLPLARTRTRS